MQALVTLEQRFERTPDGHVWTPDQYRYSFFDRYLQVFDHVKVLSRVNDVPTVPDTYIRADGDGVTMHPLPHYQGMGGYIRQRGAIRDSARQALTLNDAVIMRIPSILANILVPILKENNFPYGVEVTSDPAITFARGTMRNPLRPLLRFWLINSLKSHCKDATAASYVTREYLQKAYPCPGPMVGISSVEIDDTALVEKPKQFVPSDDPVKLVFVGNLDQLYKAPDVMVDALKLCLDNGLNLHLVMVGDGIYRPQIEEQVRNLNLESHITFLGKLPGASAVRSALDQADLFVMPSRAEGLPRAMIEAMARGLPCIATTVGGIPELAPPEDLVPPEDAQALADTIQAFVTNPARMNETSQRNLNVAKEYHKDKLEQQRRDFYGQVKSATENYLVDD